MHQFRLIIFFLFFVSSQTTLASFVPAKLTKNLNPKGTQSTTNLSRVEGWTLMSYIIDDNGLPTHIEIINSSNNGKYTNDSINFLKNFRYSPAIYMGEKTLSAKTFFLKHDNSFIGSNNDGISVGFRLRYERAYKLISENKFDDALEVLDNLQDSNAKNLTEQALSAWIHSLYFFHQKNWLAYRDNVLEAYQLREYLPVKMAIKSTENLLQWQMFQKEYSDAVYTLSSMKNIKSAKMDDSSYNATLQPILDIFKNDASVEINTTLSEGKAWLHKLPRSNINLTTISGEVKLAELRCDNRWHSFDSPNNVNFKIPKNHLNCSILVKGKAGTKIKFIEHGEIRDF